MCSTSYLTVIATFLYRSATAHIFFLFHSQRPIQADILAYSPRSLETRHLQSTRTQARNLVVKQGDIYRLNGLGAGVYQRRRETTVPAPETRPSARVEITKMLARCWELEGRATRTWLAGGPWEDGTVALVREHKGRSCCRMGYWEGKSLWRFFL
ncbi:hypothetical protein B0O99DRAFT_616721 [Bisporella sp. PMI_857]|nr:hypothetical protein B0O99DRAFT_616721 [Bisporella sp. PMI_857]